MIGGWPQHYLELQLLDAVAGDADQRRAARFWFLAEDGPLAISVVAVAAGVGVARARFWLNKLIAEHRQEKLDAYQRPERSASALEGIAWGWAGDWGWTAFGG